MLTWVGLHFFSPNNYCNTADFHHYDGLMCLMDHCVVWQWKCTEDGFVIPLDGVNRKLLASFAITMSLIYYVNIHIQHQYWSFFK